MVVVLVCVHIDRLLKEGIVAFRFFLSIEVKWKDFSIFAVFFSSNLLWRRFGFEDKRCSFCSLPAGKRKISTPPTRALLLDFSFSAPLFGYILFLISQIVIHSPILFRLNKSNSICCVSFLFWFVVLHVRYILFSPEFTKNSISKEYFLLSFVIFLWRESYFGKFM